jgi:anti-sigma factor RsiW
MNMRDEHYQKIMEAGWRRPLSADEEAALQQFLAAHPEARQAWAEEAALNRLLQRWPVPAVSSNFTARVLQAAQNAPVRSSAWRDWFAPSQWLPEGRVAQAALCSLMVCAALFSFHQSQVMHRERMAREAASASRLATLPSVEWLKDFDTIKGISQTRVADDDLLAALE